MSSWTYTNIRVNRVNCPKKPLKYCWTKILRNLRFNLLFSGKNLLRSIIQFISFFLSFFLHLCSENRRFWIYPCHWKSNNCFSKNNNCKIIKLYKTVCQKLINSCNKKLIDSWTKVLTCQAPKTLPTKCLSVSDHFVKLALKGLTWCYVCNKAHHKFGSGRILKFVET